MMKKYTLLFGLAMLSLLFISCGTVSKVGEKSAYTITNNFSDAVMKIESDLVGDKLTVEFSYSGEYEMLIGQQYEIEIQQDNEWYTLEYDEKDISDIGAAQSVKNEVPLNIIYNLARYGKLSAGHYRIIVPVFEKTSSSLAAEEYILAAEFDIK